MESGLSIFVGELLAGGVLAILGYIAAKIRRIEKHTKENKRHIKGEDENPHHEGILSKLHDLEEKVKEQMNRLREVERRLRQVENKYGEDSNSD